MMIVESCSSVAGSGPNSHKLYAFLAANSARMVSAASVIQVIERHPRFLTDVGRVIARLQTFYDSNPRLY